MNPEDLKKRTKQFGLRVMRLVEALPKTQTAYVIGKQLLRSATSVGANYRAAAEVNQKPILSQNWALLKKKPTNQFIGWRCLSREKS